MAVNVGKYVAMHNKRKVKKAHMAAVVGSLSLAALFTVSWGMKLIGFSLTDKAPFDLSTSVDRLDTPNPDTSLTGGNFYRQYLNVKGNEEVTPIDLLILVDQSGSMAANKDFAFGDKEEYRDVIMSSLLNGAANADYRDNPDLMNLDENVIDSMADDNGFVNQFLRINPDNNIAIIGLDTIENTNLTSTSYTNYEDAKVILDWTNTPLTEKGVDVTAKDESGTDYAAGFMLANEMLSSDKIANNNHKKVVIIISDGEPTCYTDSLGNRVENVLEAPAVVEETSAPAATTAPVTPVVEETIPVATTEAAPVETTAAQEEEIIETAAAEVTNDLLEADGFDETSEPQTEEEVTVEEEIVETEPSVVEETTAPVVEETIAAETTATEIPVETEATEPAVVETEPQVTEPQVPTNNMDSYKNDCDAATLEAFENLIKNNENLIVYSVGISGDLKDSDRIENKDQFITTQLVSEDGEYIYVEKDSDELREKIFSIVEKDIPNNVVVTAELSKYVEVLPIGSSDIKVTMTNSNGETTVLFDERDGSLTTEGSSIIDNFTITAPADETADTTGTITLVFKPEYVLEKGTTYTLSYNVGVTEAALDAYFDGGYTDKGDKDTDFDPSTKLSSGEKGFNVNNVAYVTYKLNGVLIGADLDNKDYIFGHPVVQIEFDLPTVHYSMPTTYATSGEYTGEKVKFSKTIDKLGDGENNPDTSKDDTTITDGDYYRLYLDVEGLQSTQTPRRGVDLLIIVDQSGSMYDKADVAFGENNNNEYRDVVISNILNGDAKLPEGADRGNTTDAFDPEAPAYKINSTVTDDSIINQFLNQNPYNKVAVIGFDAWRNPDVDKSGTNESRDYTLSDEAYAKRNRYLSDSRVILPWTSTPMENGSSGVNVTGHWNTGTNYSAGFRLAYDMFKEINDAEASIPVEQRNQKVMIFISDGVPTCYIPVGLTNSEAEQLNAFIQANTGRYGSTFSHNNGDPDGPNIFACQPHALASFRNLLAALDAQGINITAFSLGISNELASSDDENPEGDYVIRQCITPGTGGFYRFAKNGNELDEVLHQIVNYKYPSQVVITDNLSQYVKYYDAQPDVKVVMTNKTNPSLTHIIYDSANPGNVAEEYKGIIKSVTHTPIHGSGTTTGVVKATFNPDYSLEDDWVYTLSYNVKVTDVAYVEYTSDGYPIDKPGQAGTDYKGNGVNNQTSSGEEGFYSNESATVEYFIECKEVDETYDHPVVQVDDEEILTKIEVNKVWKDETGNTLPPVEPVKVQLYQVSTVNGSTKPVDPSIYEDFNNIDNLQCDIKGQGFNISIVNANDGKAAQVTGRTSNWQGFDFDLMPLRGKTVDIEVSAGSSGGRVDVILFYNDGREHYLGYGGDTSLLEQYYPEPIRLTGTSNSTYKQGTATINVPSTATSCTLYLQTANNTDTLNVDYVYIKAPYYAPDYPDANTDTALYQNFSGTSGVAGPRGGVTVSTSTADNALNGAIKVTGRSDTWMGVSIPLSDNFIGKTIDVDVRGNGARCDLRFGLQYTDSNGEPKYDDVQVWNSSYQNYGARSYSWTIPADASNASIYIQGDGDNANGKTSDLIIDYVYISEHGQPRPSYTTTSTDVEKYGDPITLSTSNVNKHIYDLPLWGLDSNGNKIYYTYYLEEDLTGTNYKETVIDRGFDESHTVTDGLITVTNTIEGEFGYQLPSTGGIGTGFNYLIGLMLMAIPGGFYIKRIRKRSVRDP